MKFHYYLILHLPGMKLHCYLILHLPGVKLHYFCVYSFLCFMFPQKNVCVYLCVCVHR